MQYDLEESSSYWMVDIKYLMEVVFLLFLCSWGAGTLSKHPKPGVRQMLSGLIKPGSNELDQVAELWGKGLLKAAVMSPQYPLAQAADALTRSTESGVLGKIAIIP